MWFCKIIYLANFDKILQIKFKSNIVTDFGKLSLYTYVGF